ncbi:ABC transporter substrate-binding protein [Treponema sp.]
MKTRVIIATSLVLVVSSYVYAGANAEKKTLPSSGKAVVVSSKIDTEGALLGSMMIAVLENAGIKTEDRTELGPTDVVRKAIFGGEIDLYAEYTGNGAFFFQSKDSSIWKDREKAWQRVKQLDYDANKLVWLESAPANNTWAIAIREDLAQKEGLISLEDLSAYLARGGAFKIAASEEFVSRPDALPAFESVYGFKLQKDQMLVLSGGNTATTEQAAARQSDGVNASMAYGTDGQLAALGLRVLRDSKGVQPVYEPAPVIREAVLAEYPQIQEILAPVFRSLGLETLQKLNSQIAVEGKNARAVAEAYLREAKLIK